MRSSECAFYFGTTAIVGMYHSTTDAGLSSNRARKAIEYTLYHMWIIVLAENYVLYYTYGHKTSYVPSECRSDPLV